MALYVPEAGRGAWIKGWRQGRALTQQQLAVALGVALRTIGLWENDHARPSALAWQRVLELVEAIEMEEKRGGAH